MNHQNLDAAFCGKQPLHFINEIQPHGVLIVVAKADLRIVQVSANVSELIDRPERVLNQPLLDFVSAESFSDLTDKVKDIRYAVPVILSFKGPSQKDFYSLVHERDECLLIETEFSNFVGRSSESFHSFFSQLQTVTSAINGAKTIEEVVSVAAREIRALSGFDKVMIYSFDEEWNGTVIAEEMSPGMDSYLGLKFPASDVPKPARDLYLRNPYRIIPNRDYTPIALVPDINPVTGMVTDLTASHLRSVVSVHLEYLQNMHVVASMSTRIIHKEQLWGLIACHHKTAKYLSFQECSIFEVLTNVISSKISSIVNRNTYETIIRLNDYYTKIVSNLPVFDNLIKACYSHRETLLSMLGADGIGVCWNNEILTIGLTPGVQQIESLREWLSSKGSSQVLHLNALSAAFEHAKEYANVASGLLVLPIQPYEGNYILAFRGEMIKKVRWGGNPDQAITFEKNSTAYHPRNSFKVWKETVRNTSDPWTAEELSIAERFRNVVVEHTLENLAKSLERKVKERTRALEQSKSALEQTFDELMQFTYVASHDLQEPVRKIRLFGNKLKSVLADEGANDSLDRLLAASKRINQLLADLINYSKLSNSADPVPTDLNEILNDAIRDFDLIISERNIEVRSEMLPVIEAVPDQMRQVFLSLIGNAIKFAKEDTPLTIDIRSEMIGNPADNGQGDRTYCRITVKDNGIGFDQEYAEQVFGMFKSVHPKGSYEGTGIGLAITRKIIDRHHGKITAEAMPDEGATFSIVLPLKQKR